MVQPGNNLYSIARYFGTTLAEVIALNPNLGDPGDIRAGNRIRIPAP